MALDTSFYGNIRQPDKIDITEPTQKAMALQQLGMQNQHMAKQMQQEDQQHKLLAIGGAVEAIQGLPEDQKPDAYKAHVGNLIKIGAIGPNDVPPEYDKGLVDSVHYQLNNNPQYAQIRKNSLENKKLEVETKTATDARDPQSGISAQARNQYGALFPELKKSMGDSWDGLSKAQVDEAIKPFEFKSKLDETHTNNQYKQTVSQSIRDEKADKEQQNYAKALKDDLDANKGRSGNFGIISGKVQSAERLEGLGNQFKDGNLPAAQMEEMALGMANMIGGSNGAARSQVEALVPHSAMGDVNKFKSWLMNEPNGAGQQQFVDMMLHTIGREKDIANGQLNQIRMQRLPAHEVFKRKYPDQYKQVLRGYGIDPDSIGKPSPNDPSGKDPGLVDQASSPKHGTVEDGFVFMGGDPSDQANWKRVK